MPCHEKLEFERTSRADPGHRRCITRTIPRLELNSTHRPRKLTFISLRPPRIHLALPHPPPTMQPRVHLADAFSALCLSVFDRSVKSRQQRKLDAAALAAFDERVEAERAIDEVDRCSMPSILARRASMPAPRPSLESVGRAPAALAPPALTNAGEASGLLAHIVQRCRRTQGDRKSVASPRDELEDATRSVPDDVRMERAQAATPQKVARADSGPGSPTSVLVLGASIARSPQKEASRRASGALAMAVAERDAYAAVIDRVRREATEAAAAVERLHAHAMDLERIVAERNRALGEKDAELAEAVKESDSLRSQLEKQRAEHGELAEELKKANQGFRELQRVMRRASGTYSAARDKVSEELTAAKAEVKRLREETDAVRAAAATGGAESSEAGSPGATVDAPKEEAQRPAVRKRSLSLARARTPGRHSPLAEIRERRRQAAEDARQARTKPTTLRPPTSPLVASRELREMAAQAARARRLSAGKAAVGEARRDSSTL